jgi:RNA polymerase sigma-70 factor (ECF subfamily)
VIHQRVARALLASAAGRQVRNIREEVADLTQEIFGLLFTDNARLLRAWEPNRGRSLKNYVALIARTRAISILRTAKRNPWQDDLMDDDTVGKLKTRSGGVEGEVASRQLYEIATSRVLECQSAQGHRMYQLLIAQGLDIREVCDLTGLSENSVYQWRSRLVRALRKEMSELLSEDGDPPRRAGQR